MILGSTPSRGTTGSKMDKQELLRHEKVELDLETAKFLFYVMTKCLSDGISFHIYPSCQISADGSLVAGYFDDENHDRLALHSVIRSPNTRHTALGTVVHEFCHTRQYIEKDPCYWINGDTKITDSMYEKWDKWIAKESEYTEEEIDEFITICMQVEANCERRTVEMIKEFKLPIDIEQYTKEANAYILFYRVMQKERKWCNVKDPAEINTILELMPTEIVTDLRTLPNGYYELVAKNCLEEDDVQTDNKNCRI